MVDRGGDALDSDGAESNLRGFDGLLGVQAGYDRQFGAALFGLEADISHTWWDRSKTFSDDYRVESSMDWLATFRARMGLVHNNALFYLTGGVGLADISGCASDDETSCVPDDDEIVTVDTTAWGFVAGAEFKFSNSLSFKAEYLYFQSAEKSVAYDSSEADEIADFSASAHLLRAGISYRFH